jgi:hypothetical protein
MIHYKIKSIKNLSIFGITIKIQNTKDKDLLVLY